MRRLASIPGRLLFVLLALLSACDADPVHAFVGRRFEPGARCLDPPSVLDVVVGDAGACPLKCLVFHADGAAVAYTTLDCPPYPVGFDPTELDPECRAAKAAFDAKATCAADAGTE